MVANPKIIYLSDRREAVVKPINNELADLLLKRPHYIHMFENGTIQNLITHYNTAKGELLSKIQRLEDVGQGYTLPQRLEMLNSRVREIDAVLKNATNDSINEFSYDLHQFAGIERDFYRDMLSGVMKPIGVNIVDIPLQHVVEMVETPIGGLLYSERMIQRYAESVWNIKQELTQSLIQGEDMAKAGRRLFGQGAALGGVVGERLMKQSSVIARTEIMRVSNSVSQAIYEANKDIIKGLEFCASLDDRTCLACGAMDGKVFYFEKGRISTNQRPPLHPLCRCCMLPITKSWRELGVKADEVPPSTRASFSGQVPATEKYGNWLRRMNIEDPAFVKNILGPKRYDLWNQGKLVLTEMAKDNRVLSLADLERLGKITKMPTGGLGAELGTNAEWALTRKIDGSTLDGFITSVKAKKWDDVTKFLDDALAKNPLADVQHNLNDVNIMRYMYEKGMTSQQMRDMLGDYSTIVKQKLYSGGSPVKPIPAEIEARMSAKQIAAHKNAWIKTKADQDMTELMERKVARQLGAEHITGNRPFDMFLDNEFIEFKTVLNNTTGIRHQIWMDKEAIVRKTNFEKMYGVRGHTVVVDSTPGSDTFGKMFYRQGHANYSLSTMQEVRDMDHLRVLIKKGAKKFDEPPIARAKVPATKTLKQSENWMKTQLGIKEVDYDDLDNRLARLFNDYAKGAFDELKVRPTAIRFDAGLFTGRNRNLAGLSFEDGTIAFNPKYMRTIDDIQRLVNEQKGLDWFTTGSKGHVFRHELGHQKYFKLGGTEASAGKKLSQKTISDLRKGIGRTDMPRFVSKYALKNEGEFYAEMAARQLNGQAIHPVTKKLMIDIEKSLKKDLSKTVGKKGVGVKPKVVKVKPVEKGTLGELSTGTPVKSAEDILKYYKDSKAAIFVEGKTPVELKANLCITIGKKNFDLKSKEMDSLIRYFTPVKSAELTLSDYELGIKRLIQRWARTSGDSNPGSVMMQLAAKAEFNLEGSSIWFDLNTLKNAEALFEVHGKAIRQILRDMYNNTQAYLTKQGLKTVRVSRGYLEDIGEAVSTKENPLTNVQIQLQPMSSFSADFETAKIFTDGSKLGDNTAVFFAEVPVERVFSIPVTGFGTVDEFEYVILGSQKKGGESVLATILNRNQNNLNPWKELFGKGSEAEKKISEEIFKKGK